MMQAIRPSHRCRVCGAGWYSNPAMSAEEHETKHCRNPQCPLLKGTWSVVRPGPGRDWTNPCGSCCDNASMTDQIEPWPEDEAEALRREIDFWMKIAAAKQAQVQALTKALTAIWEYEEAVQRDIAARGEVSDGTMYRQLKAMDLKAEATALSKSPWGFDPLPMPRPGDGEKR
jgi:hypothetical protein